MRFNVGQFCLLLAVIALHACAAPAYSLKTDLPSGPLPVRLVAVYPFTFTYESQPYMSYEKTWDQLAEAAACGRFLILDPTEFTIHQNRPENAFATSTLVMKAAKMGVRPDEIAVLRGRVERRVTEGAAAIFDAQGKRAGAVGNQTELYIVRVEVFHPATGAVLVSAEQTFSRDPLAETPAWDRNPELSSVVRTLSARAVAELAASASPPPLKRPPGFAHFVNHHGLFRYALPEGVSLDASAKGLDIVEKEALRWARYQYFDKDMSDSRFKLYERHPYGLLVTSVEDEGLKASGVKAGDVILKAGKRKLTGPHKLWRGFRRDTCAKPLKLMVARGAEVLTLSYSGPCSH
ncbi:MAG: hypothetical protein HY897_26260 [Deltaproteobacteria bacterium]|nr:hypothetical protein [Deltaproteobacteria bacterium]